MIDNVVINARALSIITAMADVPRDRLMAAHMIIRLDLDKYVYMKAKLAGIFLGQFPQHFFVCVNNRFKMAATTEHVNIQWQNPFEKLFKIVL